MRPWCGMKMNSKIAPYFKVSFMILGFACSDMGHFSLYPKKFSEAKFKKVVRRGPAQVEEYVPYLVFRNDVFRDADLLEEVRYMSEIEKDTLFVKAREYQLKRVIEDYPKIPQKKLEKFKELILK